MPASCIKLSAALGYSWASAAAREAAVMFQVHWQAVCCTYLAVAENRWRAGQYMAGVDRHPAAHLPCCYAWQVLLQAPAAASAVL
jgi:hypothetical protein